MQNPLLDTLFLKELDSNRNRTNYVRITSLTLDQYPIEQIEGVATGGSITIDGISLTVAAVGRDSFKVSIIPHTLKETVLGHKKNGDIVNLENDVVGKYIKKFLGREEQCKESRLKELLMI